MNAIDRQIPWVGDNVQGHSWDNGQIDLTEGFGAYDDVFERGILPLGSRIVDVGGGSYDTNSAYVAQKYFVECSVYDPYKRDAQHNLKVIESSRVRPFDGAVSFSVLNVISDDQARREHIQLCQNMLKAGGKVVFKVWPGDETGIGKPTVSGYQSNRDIHTYVDEIRDVFGSPNVIFDPDSKIIIGIAREKQFPSARSKNHFGDSLIATSDLPIGVIVQKFLAEPTEKAFNGDLNAPLDERHVILLGKDSDGKLLYGRVISDAAYVNHSCNPNCEVNSLKEICTIKPVKKDEELTISYDAGSGEWDPSWNFRCLCMAKNCRGIIDSYKKLY